LTLPKTLAKCSKAAGDEEDILEELEELSDGVLEFRRDLLEPPFEPPQADRSVSGPFFITLPEETPPVLKKGVPLSDAEMELIITMRSHNKNWTEIGRALHRPESTGRAFWNHHNERGGTFRAPRGRPKKRTEATTKAIVDQVEKDRRLSVRAAAGQLAPKTKISPESVRVQRHENGLHFTRRYQFLR
jgi:transposase